MSSKFRNLFFVLLLGILMLWTMRNSDIQRQQIEEQQRMARERATLDSLAQVARSEAEAAAKLKEEAAAILDSTQQESPAEEEQPALPRRLFVVETDRFWVTFDSRGASVSSLRLKALPSLQDGSFPEMLQRTEEGLLTFEIDAVDFTEREFAYDSSLADTLVVNDTLRLTFTWEENGKKVTRTFGFSKEQEGFSQELVAEGFREGSVLINWNSGLRETEMVPENSGILANYFFSEVVMNRDYSVVRETPKGRTVYNEDQGRVRWVGLRRKYTAGVIRFETPSEHKVTAVELKPEKGDFTKPTWKLLVRQELDAGKLNFDFDIFPLERERIVAKEQGYEKIIVSGWEWIGAHIWFVALTGLILKLLNLFFALIPNYGVAIILLTLLVKFATLPLTLKQMKSMRAMQLHQPALTEIRKKYRDDPRKMQMETMAYYQKAGINPFAQMLGCLPMFLQMPIFIALFIVLGRAVELRSMPFIGWITDLSMPDIITQAVHIPLIMPMGLSVLPFVMAATTFYQMKQTTTDPNQKSLAYIMPIMMFAFSGMMPSGLVLYWIVSNIFSIVQYIIIGSPAKAAAEAKANSSDTKKNAIDAPVRSAKKKKKKK